MKRLIPVLVACTCIFAQLFSQSSPSAIVNNKELIVRVENGVLIKQYAYSITVLNRDGDNYARVAIPFSGLRAVSDIKAHLSDENGKTVRKLKQKDISEKSAMSEVAFYDDNYIKYFWMRHNRYPYTLHYSYESREKQFMMLAHWSPVEYSKVPTVQASLKVIVPSDYEIRIDTQHVQHYERSEQDGQVSHEWRGVYVEGVERELYAPPGQYPIMRVVAIPLQFSFEHKGSFDSWQSLGQWQAQIVNDADNLPPQEIARIKKLVQGTSSKREKVKRIYKDMQEKTRYIYVGIETGGFKPLSAAYVAENRYGDCKALANYTRSALSAVGVPSYYSIVYAGDRVKKVKHDFPAVHHFNHIILSVPLEQDTLWLDCTKNGAFNYLGAFTQNRYALVVDGEKSQLVKTPAYSEEEVHQIRRISFGWNEQLDCEAQIRHTLKGNDFDRIDYVTREIGKHRHEEVLKRYFTIEGLQPKEKPRVLFEGEDLPVAHIEYAAHAKTLCKLYGNEMLMKLPPTELPAFERPEKRTLPVQLDFPVHVTDTLVYKLPQRFKKPALPNPHTIESAFGYYHLSSHWHQDALIVVKSFLLRTGTYETDEYESFYAFLQDVKAYERKTAIAFTKISRP